LPARFPARPSNNVASRRVGALRGSSAVVAGAFPDIPRTELFFADTHDRYGPLGAKPLGEAPIIPVSPAMGNALADATGIRFHSLPFSADGFSLSWQNFNRRRRHHAKPRSRAVHAARH
jgi:hypothetical protein